MENQKHASYFAVQIVLVALSCAFFGAVLIHFLG